MSFSKALQKVMEDLKEAQGIALVGMDGIVVEEQKKDPALDLQSLGAEGCALIKQTDKGMSSAGLGHSEELSIMAEGAVLILRRIHNEYFLMLALHRDGNLGKGRYLLRREGMRLKGEL